MAQRITDTAESREAIRENREHTYERIPTPSDTLQCWTIGIEDPHSATDFADPIRVASATALSEYFWTQYARVSFWRTQEDYVLHMHVVGQYGMDEPQEYTMKLHVGKDYLICITLVNERQERRDIRFRIVFN